MKRRIKRRPYVPPIADPNEPEPVYTSFSSVSGEKEVPPTDPIRVLLESVPGLKEELTRRMMVIIEDHFAKEMRKFIFGDFGHSPPPPGPTPYIKTGTVTGRFSLYREPLASPWKLPPPLSRPSVHFVIEETFGEHPPLGLFAPPPAWVKDPPERSLLAAKPPVPTPDYSGTEDRILALFHSHMSEISRLPVGYVPPYDYVVKHKPKPLPKGFAHHVEVEKQLRRTHGRQETQPDEG